MAAVAALILVRGIDGQLQDVTESYEVRNHARELVIALSEAESSQTVLRLTGDKSYLEPFQRASASIETRLESLLSATDDDPDQAARVLSIEAEIRARVAEMHRLVQEAENRAVDLSEATGEGVQPMAAVRSTLEQFVAEENNKLLESNRQIEQSRRWLVVSLIASLAGAVVLGYSLLARTQQQVSSLSRRSDLLTTQNELLESHVRERTLALEEARRHADHERQRVETLLQDTNHRIGNSLATVSSLLGLQMIRAESEQVKEALESARSRVHAIASSHRRLRLGSDLETASTHEFLEAVVEDIELTAADGGRIILQRDIEPIVIGSRDATTLGILVAELVTNALKHGFPDGREGLISVSLARDTTGVPILSVEDNGVGLAAEKESEGSGLGSVIVRQLSGQFGGQPIYESRPEGGLRVAVPLPTIEPVAPLCGS
jgi:two-component sensor histidine kinase